LKNPSQLLIAYDIIWTHQVPHLPTSSIFMIFTIGSFYLTNTTRERSFYVGHDPLLSRPSAVIRTGAWKLGLSLRRRSDPQRPNVKMQKTKDTELMGECSAGKKVLVGDPPKPHHDAQY
jgi:hypothetical protein